MTLGLQGVTSGTPVGYLTMGIQSGIQHETSQDEVGLLALGVKLEYFAPRGKVAGLWTWNPDYTQVLKICSLTIRGSKEGRVDR